MDVFQHLNQKQGITLAVVTHSDEVAKYANRIITFRDGLIVADEDPRSHAGSAERMGHGVPAGVYP